MPVRRLPNDPNLEKLKNEAKTLQRWVRSGMPEAADLVREFHPRFPALSAGSDEAKRFPLTYAQLVVARQHGFGSWADLRAHLDTLSRFSRAPQRQPVGAAITTDGERADEFLRLACLTHGDDDPARWRRAAELLDAHPALATTSIHAAAAIGDVAATCALLGEDPSLSGQDGGLHRWAPLLYLAYSTIDDRAPGRSHLEVARLLLDAGADPSAGYLWEGLPSPYTALTGALTSAHAQAIELGRLLLERGADANDSQALYELGVDATGDDIEALALLFEFGLGRGDGGVWHARLGPAHATPAQLVHDELIKAAASNWPRRAGLVLDHGVDLDGKGASHPIFEGLTAYELAVLHGSTEVIAAFEAAGAKPARPDDVRDFLGACVRADRPTVERMRVDDPAVVELAIARRPHQISVAADKDRLDAVILMVELGFDVNAATPYPHRQTALHGAAFKGNLAMVRYLVEHGADPALEDCSFHATPLGWAEHNNQRHIVDYLSDETT